MKNKRIIIYPQDVERITGRSVRYGQELLQEIKQSIGKGKRQFVTAEEFCKYTGISLEELEEYL
jgi:hypothetical protein